jgi:hypothetical protein
MIDAMEQQAFIELVRMPCITEFVEEALTT